MHLIDSNRNSASELTIRSRGCRFAAPLNSGVSSAMRIIATVAICFLSLGCSAAGPSVLRTDSLSLKTGGAPFEAQFTVALSASGSLNVRRYGPPHVIPRDEQFHLTTAE